jgi:hypothetical protein
LANLLEKRRRAVSVVRTALDSVGVHDRAVCVGCDSEVSPSDCAEYFAVFVSAPPGADVEPYYETGKSIPEAVRKILATIKGHEKKNGANADDQSEAAPF